MGLAGAGVLSVIAVAITPEGRVKKAVRLICGFAVVMALISGVTDFDFSFYSKSMAEYRREAEKMISESINERSGQERAYIEKESESYILDKARELGLECEKANVTTSWSPEGYWYPTAVRLAAKGDESLKSQLSGCIEAELGIAEENQTWSDTDEIG